MKVWKCVKVLKNESIEGCKYERKKVWKDASVWKYKRMKVLKGESMKGRKY